MFNILLKHLIYEKAINTIFERIQINFTKSFPMPYKNDNIHITFYPKNNRNKLSVKNALVHMTNQEFILIIYTDWITSMNDSRGTITKRMELIYKEDIITWEKCNVVSQIQPPMPIIPQSKIHHV